MQTWAFSQTISMDGRTMDDCCFGMRACFHRRLPCPTIVPPDRAHSAKEEGGGAAEQGYDEAAPRVDGCR